MHDHNYTIEFMKTPKGYLTETGFTDDINDKSIILCASNSFGKWSSMKSRIPYFARKYKGSSDISKELLSMLDELETFRYLCGKGPLCEGGGNPDCRVNCPFWNDDRNKLEFFKHY